MAILSDEALELFEVFGRWLRNYLPDAAGDAVVTEPIRSAPEAKTMFATKLREYGERLKEQAREEGRQEGRQGGRQEEKRETARAMKERGIEVAVIAEITGLSQEEIANL